MEKDLDAVFQEIAAQVGALGPSLVVVDSFRTVVRKAMTSASELEMQGFVQRLAQFLTPKGYLLIGHSESLNGLNIGLRCLRPSIYQQN